ncbi:MAG: hypothetical protein ACKO45_02495, partial [Cyanobium sp.]
WRPLWLILIEALPSSPLIFVQQTFTYAKTAKAPIGGAQSEGAVVSSPPLPTIHGRGVVAMTAESRAPDGAGRGQGPAPLI